MDSESRDVEFEFEFGSEEIEVCLAQDGAVYNSERLAIR